MRLLNNAELMAWTLAIAAGVPSDVKSHAKQVENREPPKGRATQAQRDCRGPKRGKGTKRSRRKAKTKGNE